MSVSDFQWIAAVLVVVGGLLFIVGFIFPRLSVVLPRAIQEFWFDTYITDLHEIPGEVVEGFIQLTDKVSRFTAEGATKFPAIIAICVLAVLSAYQLFIQDFDQQVAQERATWVAIVAAVAVTAYFAIQRFAKDIYTFVNVIRLNRWKNRWQSRLSLYEESRDELISDDDSTIGSSFSRWLQEQIERAESRIASLEQAINDLPDADGLTVTAQSRTFVVFLIAQALTIALLGVWVWLFPRYVGGLFTAEIFEAWRSIVYLLPFPLILFIFLQILVPTTMILLRPNTLTTDVANSDRDPLNQGAMFLFLLGAVLSVFLTYSALAIGHWLEPNEYVPQTPRMILSNGVFDGLTLMLTIIILNWAIAVDGWLKIFTITAAIAVDISIAAGLAIGSLYLGLIGGEHSLTLQECMNVLVGLHYTGEGRDFGPFFWVMHTAFLPTLLYIVAMLIVIIAKLSWLFAGLFVRSLGDRQMTAIGSFVATMGAVIQGLIVLLTH